MDDQTINSGEFYSVSDIARQLKISLAAVYELCQSGKLSHFRFGKGRGTIRISSGDLKAFLADRGGKETERFQRVAESSMNCSCVR